MLATAGSASDAGNLTLISNSDDYVSPDVLAFSTPGVDIIPRIQVADNSNFIRHKKDSKETSGSFPEDQLQLLFKEFESKPPANQNFLFYQSFDQILRGKIRQEAY